MMKRAGAAAAMLKERIWTISVVPTLAPSMIASAGTRLTAPSAASDVVISPVAVLLCSSAVKPRPAPKRGEAVAQRFAEEAAQVGTKRAQHAREDHVKAPEQQRDAAKKVEQYDASHYPLSASCLVV